MKTQHHILAFMALALTACANDDTLQSATGGEINFDVVTNALSRSDASHLYSNATPLTEFYVASYVSGDKPTVFMKPQKVTIADNGLTNYSTGVHYYWPAVPLDFYAFASAIKVSGEESVTNISLTDDVSAATAGQLTLSNITMPKSSDKQQDLIYAVTKNVTSSNTTNNTVPLIFRHALAQLSFEMQSANPALYIEITGVTLKHIYRTGSFALKTATYTGTDENGDNVDDGYYDGSAGSTLSVDGEWTVNTTAAITTDDVSELSFDQSLYAYNGANADADGTDKPVPLKTDSNNGCMFVLPQTITAFAHSTSTTSAADQFTGMAFELTCRIYSVCKGTDGNYHYDGSNGCDKTIIYATEDGETAKLIVPITTSSVSEWKAGTKYVYRFTFNDTGGKCYDPEWAVPFVAIDYTVTGSGWGASIDSDSEISFDSTQNQ